MLLLYHHLYVYFQRRLTETRFRFFFLNLFSLAYFFFLYIDQNRLRHIPSCIYHMPLVHLSLRNNDLTKIEPEIVHMRKLSTLNLNGNPLAYPPIHLATSLKLYKLIEWIQKHPSYESFRMYYGEKGRCKGCCIVC